MPTRTLNPKLLVVLAVVALAAVALGGVMTVKGDPLGSRGKTKWYFTMKATQDRTTAAPRPSVRYKVALRRHRSFRKSVRLSAHGLPKRVRVVWQLADGRTLPRAGRNRKGKRYRRAAILPAGRRTAYLVVTGTRRAHGTFTLRATRGNVKRRRVMRPLPGAVQPPAGAPTGTPAGTPAADAGGPAPVQARSPLIVASPANRTVLQGDATQYDIQIDTGGGPVLGDFSVAGLPAGATATFSLDGARAVMRVQTVRSTPVGAYDLTVRASNGAHVARAATTLTVSETKDFTITGDATQLLSPGVTAPIALRFHNPYDFALQMTQLTITATTSDPACDAEANFAVRPLDLARPLVLPPGDSTLADLAADRVQPALTMRDLPVDQGGCKGTPVELEYSGLAGR